MSLELHGERQAELVLGRLLERFGDLTPLMDNVGDAMVTSTHERFDTGRAPDGTPWTPSKKIGASTVPKPGARKNRMGPLQPTGKTLIASGRLRQSMTHRAASDHVEWGTNLPYAGVHQNGATIEGKNGPLVFDYPGVGIVFVHKVHIPARPYIGFSPRDEGDTIHLAEAYAVEAAPEMER